MAVDGSTNQTILVERCLIPRMENLDHADAINYSHQVERDVAEHPMLRIDMARLLCSL